MSRREQILSKLQSTPPLPTPAVLSRLRLGTKLGETVVCEVAGSLKDLTDLFTVRMGDETYVTNSFDCG